MKLLILLLLPAMLWCENTTNRFLMPFQNGILNYTEKRPLWIASDLVMSELLAAKKFEQKALTNLIPKITGLENSIINERYAHSNQLAVYKADIKEKEKTIFRQDLTIKIGGPVLFITGVAVTIGLSKILIEFFKANRVQLNYSTTF